MSDIASSLEQEFATSSQAERDSHIAELKQVAAKGVGQLEIRPHAIAIALLFGILGAIFVFAAVSNPAKAMEMASFFLVGVAMLAICAWAMFGPRKTRFTLCEEGVRVNDALMLWSSIADYQVTRHSYNGFPTHTSVVFKYVEGFSPPALGLFYPFGANSRNILTKRTSTRLTLHAGPRGMNYEELAERIGAFLAAAQAREELKRLRAS